MAKKHNVDTDMHVGKGINGWLKLPRQPQPQSKNSSIQDIRNAAEIIEQIHRFSTASANRINVNRINALSNILKVNSTSGCSALTGFCENR
jgi:hypothetical protein